MTQSPEALLESALKSVDWNANVAAFCADNNALLIVHQQNLKLAVWSKQFEENDAANPAICFIREMQVAGHLVVACTALASYKSAAAAMRTIVETALYYSYFRTHVQELATLARDEKWYVSKEEILEYHTQHSEKFSDVQKKLSINANLQSWYRKISAIVHGQLPGVWLSQTAICHMKHNPVLQQEVVSSYVECVRIVNCFLLCTAGRDQWSGFSTTAKQSLLHGLSGDAKDARP